MSITYAGTTLSIFGSGVDDPTGQTEAEFIAHTWVPGTCALRAVPPIMRDWVKVTEDLVCAATNVDKKGSSKWAPMTFTMSNLIGDADAAQLIYQTAEASQTQVCSFKLTLPGTGGVIYWTAQVSKFSIMDGGSQDTIHTSSVELLIQTQPLRAA